MSHFPDNFSSQDYRPSNLVDVLRWRAVHQPNRLAYTFLHDGATAEVGVTYGELDQQARIIGGLLRSLQASGKSVLLLYPAGLEYIAAFFGSLYAGALAVPLYPPRPNLTLQRLRTIVSDTEATIALTLKPVLSRIQPLLDQSTDLKALRWLVTDQLDPALAEDWRAPVLESSTLAFLQYTSGSTAQPKGVMVSHSNLWHNEQMIQLAFQQAEQSVIVGWLPLYHDMGLIGTVLQPLYLGARCILMPPADFLRSPVQWLQTISRYRATTSGGPNFAYDLCVRKVTPEQLQTLDLSSWVVAFNGAEPIRPETIERFAATFEPCGFRPESFYPCYGLAEATLFVSGSARRGQPVAQCFDAKSLEQNHAVAASALDSSARRLLSSGQAWLDQRIVIADPDTLSTCAPDRVGEIWVSGPSIAQGYWNREEETAHSFNARLSDTGEGPFLRTGDMGFLHEGELFVTGRLKDLIIIRGLNHYPQDIELTVERTHQALRPGCGAAFSIEVDGQERLVILQEIDHRRKADMGAIIRNVCLRVAEEHEVQVHAVKLIKPFTLPKTSSGKIQRQSCRSLFLESRLQVLCEWREKSPRMEEVSSVDSGSIVTDTDAIAKWLVDQLSARLGVSAREINVNQSLTQCGLDSLMAVELAHSIETTLGLSLPLAEVLESESLAALAQQLWAGLQESSATSAGKIIPGPLTNDLQPLSYGQRALWFLQQLAPDSPAYNIISAVRVRAELDVSALRSAFQELMNRHPMLRTGFTVRKGKPAQQAQLSIPVCFRAEDAATLDDAALTIILGRESRAPFDLERDPLLRVKVLSRAPQEHIIFMVLHHIVADFWSLSIMTRELGQLYEAAVAGETLTLPALKLQYTDYVQWQEEMLSGPPGESLRVYWEGRLGGELPLLDLPIDHPRPPVQTFRGASHFFSFSAQLRGSLKELARTHGATLYMTLLAAFEVLLHRYTNQEDLLIGTPTAGRQHADLAPLVGYFVNTLVLRANLAGNPAFETVLSQTRRTVLEAFEHQDYPFALLVERLHPERDLSRSPLFQVMFVLQQGTPQEEHGLAPLALGEAGAKAMLGSLPVESVALEQRVAQFDLMLMMAETEEGLSASLQYSTDLFDAPTISRLAAHFGSLLEGIANDPQARIAELPLLTETERRQLLFEWNDTGVENFGETCLHHQFEAQAERTPERTAVAQGDSQLTYLELNRRANQLAHHLRSLGVGPELLVGVMMDRTPEMLVGLLGILKAGGAYVPLDPAYPVERLQFMLDDAQVHLLLTQQSLLEKLSPTVAHVVALDAEWERIARGSEDNPRTNVSCANLAYLIYTSGSTGQPKAVAIEHHNAATLLDWSRSVFSAEHLAGVLASTSICFDLSIFEIFLPLSSGGTIILVENALQLPPPGSTPEIVLINTVPSVITELLRTQSLPASLKVVNLAGEPLNNSIVQRLYGHTSLELVYNLYGPSEDTTYSTYALMEKGSTGVPCIGRPVANTQAYVLDRYQQPVPIGVAGHLYLGGDGLARGYLRRPDITAARFVPHPFSTVAGARLYQTGDLVRYLPDGNLQYLGRNDQQVKIRGFRIELGEIEAVLETLAGVREAIVLTQPDAEGGLRLVAYVVREETQASTAEYLRGSLRERLPEYMIPQMFVWLEQLPLTPNGKVDRRALPTPRMEDAVGPRAFIAPRTEVERALAAIWSEVLRVELVGIEDNFFELGGHSLLAAQVVSRVREEMSVDVPLRLLFEQPTITLLAAHLEATMLTGQEPQLPPILPFPSRQELPLSFAQQRLWFLQQLEPDSSTYNIASAVSLSGRLNINAFEQTLNEIVRRHQAIRTTFISVEGRAVQVITQSLKLAVPLVILEDLSGAAQQSVARRLMIEEARRPFNLMQGPLLRVSLLRLGEREHVALLTMHHIISDGWSIGVLIKELIALYEAFSQGAPSPLPELSIQYADFAYWQRQLLKGEILASHLSYWKEKLKDRPAELKLPADRPRNAVQSSRGAQQSFALPASLSIALDELSAREGVTRFMTLLAAFKTLLYRYSGQTDIILGTNVANRHSSKTEALIGFFVNMLVLRTDLSGNPTFQELLQRVREVTLDAFMHQDVPFEQLVQELRPERDLRRAPLFQAVFSLQNIAPETLRFSGLTLTPLEVDLSTAKYDLVLNMWEMQVGLQGALQYSTDLFDAPTISRLLKHFARLLESIVVRPTAPLNSLEMLSAEENTLFRKAIRIEELDASFSL
jgi:amino acid adenylation domain-containing protein